MVNTPAGAGLIDAVITSDLTVKDLWLRYFHLGGTRTRQQLRDYLTGEADWPADDRETLLRALGDHPSDTIGR